VTNLVESFREVNGGQNCTGRSAFYQNVMHYSAYRGISIECKV